MQSLRDRIVALNERVPAIWEGEHFALLAEFRQALNRGEIRACERTADGSWRVNAWVKQGILSGFKAGSLTDHSEGDTLRFFDKDTYPTRALTLADRVRVVPGGTSLRDGCYVAPGVVIMPPAYVNTGAWIDEDTMIDSHALVGSCAQVGKRVHLSAAAQIGGVLEPIGATPVVIEDDVFVGGGCGIYEGTVVGEGAVLAAGTIVTSAMSVYDLARGEILRRDDDGILEIPPRAVVVPGSRPARGDRAGEWGVQLYAPVIVKYRDESTDASAMLEDALR